MPKVRLTLAALRKELRDWQTECASGMDPEAAPAAGILEFYYSQDDTGEERLKLTDAQFWGEDGEDGEGEGWPKPGYYFAAAKAGPGRTAQTLFEWVGAHLSEDFRPQEMERADNGNAHVLGWQKAHEANYDRYQSEILRVERRARQAEERENVARREKDRAVDALGAIKQENLNLKIACSQMASERDTANAERDAAVHNLNVLEEEGGEMAPVAGAVAQNVIDRVADYMGFDPNAMPPPVRDAYETIGMWVIHRNDLWPTLVSLGLPYEAVRYLLRTIHDIDPGQDPPEPNTPWNPPQEDPPEEDPENNSKK